MATMLMCEEWQQWKRFVLNTNFYRAFFFFQFNPRGAAVSCLFLVVRTSFFFFFRVGFFPLLLLLLLVVVVHRPAESGPGTALFCCVSNLSWWEDFFFPLNTDQAKTCTQTPNKKERAQEEVVVVVVLVCCSCLFLFRSSVRWLFYPVCKLFLPWPSLVVVGFKSPSNTFAFLCLDVVLCFRLLRTLVVFFSHYPTVLLV